jgi:hypothetical protein
MVDCNLPVVRMPLRIRHGRGDEGMSMTIPVTVHVEFEDEGCGEGCYALNPLSMKSGAFRMYVYYECIRHNVPLHSVQTELESGIIYRCADCRKEFDDER